MPVSFLLSGSKKVFALQGRRVAPINVKFVTGDAPLPNFTFIGAEVREAHKTVKISNFGHKFLLEGLLVCSIFTKLAAFVRVYI